MIGLPDPYRNWERLIGQIGNDVVDLLRRQRFNKEKGIISQMFNNLQQNKPIDYNQILNFSPEGQNLFAKMFSLYRGAKNQAYSDKEHALQLKRLKQLNEAYAQKQKELQEAQKVYEAVQKNPAYLHNPQQLVKDFGEVGAKVAKSLNGLIRPKYQHYVNGFDKEGNKIVYGIDYQGKPQPIMSLGKNEEVSIDPAWQGLGKNVARALNQYNKGLASLALSTSQNPDAIKTAQKIYADNAKRLMFASFPPELQYLAKKLDSAYQNPQDKIAALQKLYENGDIAINPPKELKSKYPEKYWRNLTDEAFQALLHYYKLGSGNE